MALRLDIGLAQAGVAQLIFVNMKYITCSDESRYTYWQIKVLVSNLREKGIKDDDIYVVLGTSGWNKYQAEFDRFIKGVNIIRYRDTSNKIYKASVKPFLLWKFFEQFTHEVENQWCYLDYDCILHKKLGKFKKGTIYCTDTRGYTGYDYISGKGEYPMEAICKLGGITSETLKDNDEGAGGAQYVFDNVLASTWRDIYYNSLHIFFGLTNDKESQTKPAHHDHGLQIWTSEMWATTWGFWKAGHETKIDKRLTMAMSSESMENLKRAKIIHNSGVTWNMGERFLKKDMFKTKDPLQHEDISDVLDKDLVGYHYYKYARKVLKP